MEKILERYERYSYAERQLVATESQPQGNWSMEYNRLKAKVELLQKNHRHYMGEELDSLSLKELQNLEQQLDTALKHIRTKKNQLIYESISELQRKLFITGEGDTGAKRHASKAEPDINREIVLALADQGEGEDGGAAVAMGAARSWPQHLIISAASATAAAATPLFEYGVTVLLAILSDRVEYKRNGDKNLLVQTVMQKHVPGRGKSSEEE
ncbi:hypothetical protein V6N11_063055 [Hibiscus sabdariffa]|uniref:K-box domain-containing protein n=1 Tax=Hibiscus sabdariffa TaxID=183260 RepID=A0ABR2AEC6_9ROSI